MIKSPHGLILLISVLILTSCFHDSTSTIKIFKYDESVQCDLSSGISLDDIAMELINAGVDVICAQKSHDGLIRVALCGEATGNINVYTIHKENMATAENLGFLSVNTLPFYVDNTCQ